MDYVFAQLHAKGGSTRQLVVVDAPKVAAQSMEFPEGCSLALGDGEKVFKTLGKASQAISPSNKLGPGRQAGDEWVGPRGMVYCWCPPGRFVMGSPENETGRHADEAQREVVLADQNPIRPGRSPLVRVCPLLSDPGCRVSVGIGVALHDGDAGARRAEIEPDGNGPPQRRG